MRHGVGTFEKSPARQGLDWLLEHLSTFELVSAEAQADGPWLLVRLGRDAVDEDDERAELDFAIWKTTGAVHAMLLGAVTDDPLYTP